MKKSIAIYCFFHFTLLVAYSQDFDAHHVFEFGNSLFQEGDYLNAAREYKRYIFFYPKGEHNELAHFSLAASYQNAGRLETAIEVYQALIDTYPQSMFIERARSNIAQCQLLQGSQETAIASLQQFLSDYPTSGLAPRAQFIIAMINMDGKEWVAASEAWQQVLIKYPQSQFADASDRLARLVLRGESLPSRSPTLAGVLSALVPGLGQSYSGRLSDGFQSFLVVGGLIGGTAYYINQEQYEVAIPLGIIGAFFYAGNVYGGIQSARVFARQQEDGFLEQLRSEIYQSGLFAISPSASTETPLVRLQGSF